MENKPPKPIKARNSKTHSKSPNPNGNVILPSPQDARQDFAPPSVDYFNPVPNSYPTSSHCHLQPPPSPRTMYIHSPMVPSPENHHNLHLPSPNTTQYHAHSPSSYQVIPPARAISMHSPGGSSGGRGGGGGSAHSPHSPMQVVLSPMQPIHGANMYGMAPLPQQQQGPHLFPVQYCGYGDPAMQQQQYMMSHQEIQQHLQSSMGLQQPCYYQEGPHSLLHT